MKIKIPGGSNLFSFENCCAYEDVFLVSAFGMLTKLSLGGRPRPCVLGTGSDSPQTLNLVSAAVICELETKWSNWEGGEILQSQTLSKHLTSRNSLCIRTNRECFGLLFHLPPGVINPHCQEYHILFAKPPGEENK